MVKQDSVRRTKGDRPASPVGKIGIGARDVCLGSCQAHIPYRLPRLVWNEVLLSL
jgi:hypothetical protein